MKRHETTTFFRLFFSVLFFITITLPVQAQIPFPGGDPNVPDVPEAPIDGLIGLALIAGAYVGIKNFKKNNF
ncbi:hypothetical protein [Haloflavibacter putidus]|uniref:Uncharacterized protein n=1 Tax=Haloflavibacter putidus TaxID=2576776 RepID=A0A507ZRP7_9FLAO|nr:hypothetical protein [Haloflavibacter putidus]TQD40476.1 hypothetical protein FKR84_00430 [Haloflavibacter putidus]